MTTFTFEKGKTAGLLDLILSTARAQNADNDNFYLRILETGVQTCPKEDHALYGDLHDSLTASLLETRTEGATRACVALLQNSIIYSDKEGEIINELHKIYKDFGLYEDSKNSFNNYLHRICEEYKELAAVNPVNKGFIAAILDFYLTAGGGILYVGGCRKRMGLRNA